LGRLPSRAWARDPLRVYPVEAFALSGQANSPPASWPALAYRVTSWLAAAASFLVGGVVLYDGLTGSLAPRYRIVTLVVALSFLLTGLMAALLARRLGQLWRHPASRDSMARAPELIRVWRAVHLLLTLAAAFLLLLMSGALIGLVERLQAGSRIFG
jgi:hypothetical protein